MTETTQETTQESAPQEQPGTDLTINDLNALKTIIDIASSRGAFKPSEMVAVGQTYTKLDSFLTSIAEQAKAGAQ
jgi:hypothetical protein